MEKAIQNITMSTCTWQAPTHVMVKLSSSTLVNTLSSSALISSCGGDKCNLAAILAHHIRTRTSLSHYCTHNIQYLWHLTECILQSCHLKHTNLISHQRDTYGPMYSVYVSSVHYISRYHGKCGISLWVIRYIPKV